MGLRQLLEYYCTEAIAYVISSVLLLEDDFIFIRQIISNGKLIPLTSLGY